MGVDGDGAAPLEAAESAAFCHDPHEVSVLIVIIVSNNNNKNKSLHTKTLAFGFCRFSSCTNVWN